MFPLRSPTTSTPDSSDSPAHRNQRPGEVRPPSGGARRTEVSSAGRNRTQPARRRTPRSSHLRQARSCRAPRDDQPNRSRVRAQPVRQEVVSFAGVQLQDGASHLLVESVTGVRGTADVTGSRKHIQVSALTALGARQCFSTNAPSTLTLPATVRVGDARERQTLHDHSGRNDARFPVPAECTSPLLGISQQNVALRAGSVLRCVGVQTTTRTQPRGGRSLE